MSRMLVATLWAGTMLMATAGTAHSATEWGDATAVRDDPGATWLDIGLDDDVFPQPAPGAWNFEPATRSAPGFGAVSIGPHIGLASTRRFDDPLPVAAFSGDAWDTLTGTIGLRASGLFDSAMGPLEALLDLYLAQEFDIDGLRMKTLPGALRRDIRAEPVDPTRFDLENALNLRIKGMVPGYFQYETRVRVRGSGVREITGGIRFRW